MKNNDRAFTMIEIMLVVVVTGVLSAIAIPRYVNSTREANQNSCDANVVTLNSQWELKYIGRNLSTYPALSELSHDTSYFPGGQPVCPYKTPYEDVNSDYRVEQHVH